MIRPFLWLPAVVASSLAVGQDGVKPADASGTKAEDAIKRAVEAHGGESAMRKVADSGRWETEFTIGSMTLPVVIFRRGDAVRYEFAMDSGTAIKVASATGGWVRFPGGDVTDLSEKELMTSRAAQQHTLKLLLNAQQGLAKATLVGTEKLPDGREALRLEIQDPATSFWFDPSSGRVIAVGYRSYSSVVRADAQLMSLLSDYKRFDGVEVATLQKEYVNNSPVGQSRVVAVSFKTGATDADFKRPEPMFKKVGNKSPAVEFPTISEEPSFTGEYEMVSPTGSAGSFSETFKRYKLKDGIVTKADVKAATWTLETFVVATRRGRPERLIAKRVGTARTDACVISWTTAEPTAVIAGEDEGSVSVKPPAQDFLVFSGALSGQIWPTPSRSWKKDHKFKLSRFVVSTAPTGNLLGGYVTGDAVYLGEEDVKVPAGSFTTDRYQMGTTNYWVDSKKRIVVKAQFGAGVSYQLKSLTAKPEK